MRALVKALPEPGLVLTSVPEPAAGPDDVLVRVRRAGACGTDLHIRAWDAWAQRTVRTPLVIGLEFVGEVVDSGANVHDFAAGDLVSGEGRRQRDERSRSRWCTRTSSSPAPARSG